MAELVLTASRGKNLALELVTSACIVLDLYSQKSSNDKLFLLQQLPKLFELVLTAVKPALIL